MKQVQRFGLTLYLVVFVTVVKSQERTWTLMQGSIYDIYDISSMLLELALRNGMFNYLTPFFLAS